MCTARPGQLEALARAGSENYCGRSRSGVYGRAASGIMASIHRRVEPPNFRSRWITVGVHALPGRTPGLTRRY